MSNKIFKKFKIDYILKNYFYLIVLLLIPLILISGFLYLIVPNYENMRIEIDTAINLENKYSELKTSHINKLKEYKNNFDLVDNKYLEKIKKILPYNKDIDTIINEINQISKTTGVDIEKIVFEDQKDNVPNANNTNTSDTSNKFGPNIKNINFSINIKNGKDYKTFKNFLSGLTSDVRLFNINSFYVSSDFNKYTFNITCYYKDI